MIKSLKKSWHILVTSCYFSIQEVMNSGKNDKKGVVTNDAFSTIGDDDL